jgi:ABC-type Fe3+/spermidine/putrescine transport system ATPase subunit
MQPISIQSLVKRYGPGPAAVDRIALRAERGEVTTLLGPSGCGKTTTLRCVAGLETPQEGEIAMGDTVLFSSRRAINVPSEARNIGMVFQNYALWPHMSVRDNIGFALSLRGWSKGQIADRIKQVLSLLKLAERIDAMPGELSGGQQQRIALGRALAYNPEVLLLDEPLANLDARLREEMRFELRSIQQRTGVTTLCVTHDQSEAMVLSDKIVVMRDGGIEQEGTPRDIYERPRTEFAARFVGLSNLIGIERIEPAGNGLAARTPFGPVVFHPNGIVQARIAKLSIRPEDVRLTAGRDGEVVNLFPAKVSSVIYQGENMAVFADLGGQEIRAHVRRGRAVQQGHEVFLTLPPERIVPVEA